MKKTVVDYRGFRPSKINEPQFAHLKLLGWCILFFIMYFFTGRFTPIEKCYVVYSPLDDLFPFCEIFIVPYVLWYFLVAGSILYFALYNIENFNNLQKYIIITQVVATITYIVFPTTHNLRPIEFEKDNIFAHLVAILYQIDPPTNVLTSLHVAFSVAIASIWLREESAKLWWKIFVVIFAVLVFLSTVYTKQHSVIDGIAAMFVCLFAEYLLFWRKRN